MTVPASYITHQHHNYNVEVVKRSLTTAKSQYHFTADSLLHYALVKVFFFFFIIITDFIH